MGDAFHEVLGVFQDEVAEALNTLDTAATPDTVADTAHFLKGAALNLGMTALAEACAQAENAARGGDVGACDPALIRALYRESEQALMSGLARRAA